MCHLCMISGADGGVSVHKPEQELSCLPLRNRHGLYFLQQVLVGGPRYGILGWDTGCMEFTSFMVDSSKRSHRRQLI